MKRLAALLLAGIMILSLAACSTDDSTAAASQSTSEPQTEEQPPDTQSASDTQTTEEQPADTQSTSETQTEDQPTVSEKGAAAESDTAEQPQAGDKTDTPAEETTGSDSEQSDSASASSNILIAYFSVPETDGVDAVEGASRVVVDGEVLGNTQYIAQLIQQQTGGDLFRIETVQEYPGSHDPLLEFAYNERAEGARPSWQRRWKIWTATTSSSWVTPTGTRTCRCRSTPCWSRLTSAARRSFPLQPTAAADFPEPSRPSRSCSPT